MLAEIKTHKLSVIAVALAVILVGGSGVVGLFSLYQTRSYTQQYVDNIDMARNAQIELEKQYNSWKSVIYESEKFEQYQSNYLDYSKHLAKAQDNIFNLRTAYQQNPEIYPKLNELSDYHNKINSQYVDLITSLETAGKQERDKAVLTMRTTDKVTLTMMDEIAKKIKIDAGERMESMNTRYFLIMLTSIVVLILITLALGMWVAYKNIRMHDILSDMVEKRTSDLVEAHKNLSVSEKKYRMLADSSREMIFSLDEDFKFSRCSKAVKNYFRYTPEAISGLRFFDFIYRDQENPVGRRMIQQKIIKMTETGVPVNFNAVFKSPKNIEQKELKVHLEFVDIEGQKEILGRIEDPEEDTSLKYQKYEHSMFEIDNYLLNAEDMAFRMTGALIHYMNPGDVSIVRIALREILINAIEHGNLAIDFDEKTSAQNENTYYELIEERRADPKYSERKVQIECIIDDRRVSYKITDQGDGFDVNKYLHGNSQLANDQFLAHGRGISMTAKVFDTIQYNKKGNQVLMIKNFNPVIED